VSGPIVVRAARVEDARDIARIHVDAWRAAYRGIVPDAHLAALDVDERARKRRAHLESPPPRVRAVVAERDGMLVGWLQCGPTRDEDADPLRVLEVYAIYLDPATWRAGIGTQLMRHALESEWAERATVWSLEANSGARRFYERCGFDCDTARKIVDIGGARLVEVRYARAPIPPIAPRA
jgi:GNAT superfamily N-acetyltransferase